MHILHCVKQSLWESYRDANNYGSDRIARGSFIHCSDIDTFHRVALGFYRETDPMLLLVIDTDKVQGDIRWEDLDNSGTAYPHIYSKPLNTDAVVMELPFLRDAHGRFILNDELKALI